LLGLSCLAPTEIVVELRTDVACNVVAANEVGVAVAKPGDEDAGFAAVGGSLCDGDGGLGTVVILPHDINEAVGIRVVLGVNKPTSSCTAPMYDGCIVARRSLEFIPHTPLELPIDLRQDCVGTPCDEHSTCVAPQQCADAGTTCSGGSCTVPDAGPPVGSCVEFGPIPVATQVPVGSPHIARMPRGGWAVEYESPARTVHAMMIDDTGKVMNGAGDTVMPSPVSTSGIIGPIGSDGVGYAVTYYDSSTFHFDWYTTAGAPARTTVGFGGVAPPVGGIVWDDKAQHYVFTASPITSSLSVLEVDIANSGVLTSIAKNAGSNASLSLGDQIVYLGVADTAGCYIYPCAYTGTTASCGAPFTMNGCTMVRTAANGTHFFGAGLASSQQISTVFDGTPGAPYPTLVDTPLAMVAMTAGGSSYRVVWRSSGTLMTTTFPNPPAAVSVTPNTTGYAGPGAGFDAVADDATSPAYAAVYYQFDANGASIDLVHRCK